MGVRWLLIALATVTLELGCVEQVDLRDPATAEDAAAGDAGADSGTPDQLHPDADAPDAHGEDRVVHDADGVPHDVDGGARDAELHPDTGASTDGGVTACAAAGHECVANAEMPGTCPGTREQFVLACDGEMLACCGPVR